MGHRQDSQIGRRDTGTGLVAMCERLHGFAVLSQAVLGDSERAAVRLFLGSQSAGRLRLMRRFVPEKTFEKSFRKQMGVAD